MKNKFMSALAAIELIKSGDTLAVAAVGLIGYPELLVRTLEEKYLAQQSPGGLTIVAGCGHGNWDHRGDSRFAHTGFVKRAVVTHPETVPPLRDMMVTGEVEGYVFPQGVMNQFFRSIAAKQPGIVSKIGLGTYIDPRQDGGRIHPSAEEDLIELIELRGEEWLLFKAFPINVALLRGTTADEKGNISIENEGVQLELIELASAVRASGGKVIVQVERIAKAGTLHPKSVKLPGVLVDAVVICENVQVDHMQTAGTFYNPSFSGDLRVPMYQTAASSESLTAQDIIARRALLEMRPGDIVNLGMGIPGAVLGSTAGKEGILDDVTLTMELGLFGGQPAGWPDFGVSYNPECIVGPATMFDFYHAGGLDIAFLGAAQVDEYGNVNVSKFGKRFCGTGGFIDISQSTPKVVFCTNFNIGLEAEVANGQLIITKEGKVPKFVDNVMQISFNGPLASRQNRDITYITERCVFKLIEGKVFLTEIGPGIDLEKDILQQMKFRPIISSKLKIMDGRIYQQGRMNCFA